MIDELISGVLECFQRSLVDLEFVEDCFVCWRSTSPFCIVCSREV